MIKNRFSDVVLEKVLDGDFQTKMEGVEYSTSPREVVQIKHMENWYWRKTSDGLLDANKESLKVMSDIKEQVGIMKERFDDAEIAASEQ